MPSACQSVSGVSAPVASSRRKKRYSGATLGPWLQLAAYTSRAPFSLAAATAAEAQSLEAFKQRLVEPDSGARVEIHEAPDAAAAFSAVSRSAAEKRHSGWRINLYTSNGQNARFEAEEVKKSFEESFPGVSVDMVYDIPYFKVSAGRCVTSEEAIMLLERVRAKFPKAFLMRETLTAADLLEENPEAAAPQSPDGTEDVPAAEPAAATPDE